MSRRVSGTASRLAKIRELAGCLRRLAPDEIPIAIAFLTGETRQGKLGLAYAELHYGVVGVADGIGASISTTLAGYIADASGRVAAFLFLAEVGAVGLALVLARMPETRDAGHLSADTPPWSVRRPSPSRRRHASARPCNRRNVQRIAVGAGEQAPTANSCSR